MELCNRVKALRRNLNLTQLEFGRQLGVGRSVINNLERGVYTKESKRLSLVKLMAKTYNVSEEWLLTGSLEQPEYVPAPVRDIEAYLRGNGAAPWESAFLAEYLRLNARERTMILHFLDRVIDRAEKMGEA